MFCAHVPPPLLRRVAVVLLLATVGYLPGDRVSLNNGREIEGEIMHQSDDVLTVRTENGIVTLPASAVSSVVRESAVQNRLNSLARALARKDLRQAITALDGIPSPDDSRQEIDELLIRYADNIVSALPALTPSDASLLLAHIRSRKGRTPDAILLLQARMEHARGELTNAARRVQVISGEFLQKDLAARTQAALILSDALRHSLESIDPRTSMEFMRAFARLSQDTLSTSSATVIYLSNADSRTRMGDYSGALQVLAHHVLPVAPAIAATEIRGVLDSAEERTSPTLFARIQATALDLLEASPLSGDLVPLWERQIRILINLGKSDEAVSATLRLSSIDADAGAMMGHLVEFERRKAALSSNQPLDRYRLGVWACEVGLIDEAANMFNSVRDVPELADNAELQLELIRLNREKCEFEGIYQLYLDRKYDQAIKAAEEFRRRFGGSEFSRKAGTLIELARYERSRASEARPAQADALYQNAERLYLQGRSREALDIINRLETDYSDTEAGQRASDLRAKLGRLARLRSIKPQAPRGTERDKQLREQQLKEIQALSRGMSLPTLTPTPTP